MITIIILLIITCSISFIIWIYIKKEDKIEFIEWVGQNARPLAPNKNEWVLNKDKRPSMIYKTEELYKLFTKLKT